MQSSHNKWSTMLHTYLHALHDALKALQPCVVLVHVSVQAAVQSRPNVVGAVVYCWGCAPQQLAHACVFCYLWKGVRGITYPKCVYVVGFGGFE